MADTEPRPDWEALLDLAVSQAAYFSAAQAAALGSSQSFSFTTSSMAEFSGFAAGSTVFDTYRQPTTTSSSSFGSGQVRKVS